MVNSSCCPHLFGLDIIPWDSDGSEDIWHIRNQRGDLIGIVQINENGKYNPIVVYKEQEDKLVSKTLDYEFSKLEEAVNLIGKLDKERTLTDGK